MAARGRYAAPRSVWHLRVVWSYGSSADARVGDRFSHRPPRATRPAAVVALALACGAGARDHLDTRRTRSQFGGERRWSADIPGNARPRRDTGWHREQRVLARADLRRVGIRPCDRSVRSQTFVPGDVERVPGR